MTAAEYWDSTPRELASFLAAATQRLQEEFRMARYTAWMTVQYTRRGQPPLERVLAIPDRRPRSRSWRDQLGQAVAIYTLLTGKVAPEGVRRSLAPETQA